MMKKFIALKVSRLRLNDLGGLATETVTLATAQEDHLGEVGEAKLATLDTANTAFHTLLNIPRASELTPQIAAKDATRDALFTEIKRMSLAGSKSSLSAIAAAGKKMVNFLTPIWHIDTGALLSQTDEIDLLKARYLADTSLQTAASTLGLAMQMQLFFTASTELLTLYHPRLNEMSKIDGPSATSLKSALVHAYDEFCTTIEVTLSALPTAVLQTLFNNMNDVRRKYISRIPVPLDEAHTSVAPIPEQVYTGRHLTPLPRVFFEVDAELRELIFAQDFDVTYHNNVKVGEAKLSVHGKGKYTGRYDTTFHIVERTMS